MALTDTPYRLKIDNTYSSSANATAVGNSINSTMIAQGRPERAVVTTTNVVLLVVGLSESQAESLASALRTAWTGTARTFGKVSVVRTSDLT